MLEERMRMLEGAAAGGHGARHGAVSLPCLCDLKPSIHIVAARAMFGSCL